MYTLNCKGRLLSLEMPVVMGIINTTPDSFYADSRVMQVDKILQAAEKMCEEGAAILDIGGQSTRPGAERVGEEEELKRVLPAIEAIRQRFGDIEISIDTFYSKVAKYAVHAGATMVNDVSGGMLDPAMLQVVASLGVPYICMHMQGQPSTMQQEPYYENVVRQVLDFFISRLGACQQAGIKDVVIDPGFGFGKTIQHNFTLINHLGDFSMLGVPILMGISRKSTIYKTLGITAAEALNGTTVLHTLGLSKGVQILRVHDVREAKEAILLTQRVFYSKNG